MGVIVQVSDDEAQKVTLSVLGVDRATDSILSSEALAASLRRSASFLCPTTPRRIVTATFEVLEGFTGARQDLKADLEELLEVLIAYGDLIEQTTADSNSARSQLFLGSPRMIRRSSGAILLVGIRPDGLRILDGELFELVRHRGHLREIDPHDLIAFEEGFEVNNIVEISAASWLKAPRVVGTTEFLSSFRARLDSAGPAGEIDGIRVLDSEASVAYYRGRWRNATAKDAGTFIARRPQAFGADLWSLVKIADGRPIKLVDLPVEWGLTRGADEAWRIQAALDAERGHPQVLSIGPHKSSDMVTLYFKAPLPSWAQRRLDLFGSPAPRVPGALLAYGIRSSESKEEIAFLRDVLWLKVIEERRQSESSS